MKKTLLLTLLVAAGITATAQVKVGTNPTTLATNANFQVEGTTTADQFVVLKNGNVGIGTIAPVSKLHIAATGSSAVLSLENTATSANGDQNFDILAAKQGTGFNNLRMTANNFTFSPKGVASVFINDLGRVGIGIAAPLANLHVKSSVIIENSTTNSGFIEFFRQGQAARDGYIGFGNDGNGGLELASDVAAKPIKIITTNGHLLIGTGTGNVGIGTVTPSQKLDVNGALSVRGNGATNAVDHVNAITLVSGLNSPNAGEIRFGDGTGWKLNFAQAANDGATKLMTLTDGGDLGIGTTTPAAKLDVNGRIKISDGSPGVGKVLTSDATGLASWATPAAGGVSSVSGTAPIAVAGTTTPVISIATANTTTTGALSSTDWNTFNDKQAALTSGTNIKTINSTSVLGSGDIAVEPTVTAGTTAQYYRGDKTWQTLDKTAVGLANVDNTTDLNKPISTATQTALNAKLATADNGLTATGTLVELGGTLTKNTDIAGNFNLTTSGTGNVGIGTSAPISKLHLAGNDDQALQVQITNASANGDKTFNIVAANSVTGVWHNIGFLGNKFKFSPLGIDRVVIDENGNLGIGTTTPSAMLDVAGQVKISGGAPGAGKVLTSDAAGLASWQTVSVATVNVDNTTAPVAATVQQAVTSGSIQFTTTNTGVIMKSADGTNYMLTIENGGVLTVKKVTP